jgi:hypothetical protein
MEKEEAAGVPPRSSNVVIILVLVSVIVGAILIVRSLIGAVGGEVLARVPIAKVGDPADAPFAAAGNARLAFSVRADTCKWSGTNCLTLDVDALRGDETVAHVTCCGYRTSGGGTVWSTEQHNDACQLDIPASGADRLRVSTKLEHPRELTFEKLEVLVRSAK